MDGNGVDIPPSVYLDLYPEQMKEPSPARYRSMGEIFVTMSGIQSGIQTSFTIPLQSMLFATQVAEHLESLVGNSITVQFMLELLQGAIPYGSSRKLFDFYGGFLCINMIIRTIQVGVLARLDMLSFFARLAQYDTEPTVTRTLVDTVIYELKRSMNLGGHGITPGVPLPLFKNEVLLPEIGGLRHEDLLFILEALWEDRKQFLMVISHGSLFALGWSILFNMIFKQFEAKKTTTTGIQWAHLRQLLYRYRLRATEKDEELASVMCEEIETRSRFHEFAELPFPADCVDKEDAQMIVQSYTSRVALRYTSAGKPPEFPTSMTLIRLSQAPFDAIKETKSYHLAPSYINAGLKHVWVEMSKLKQNCQEHGAKYGVDKIILHVCQISTQYSAIISAEPGEMSPEQRTNILQNLVDGEFVNVLGRALLAYATYFSAGTDVDYGSCRMWRDLMYELKKMAKALGKRYPTNSIRNIFKPCFIDLQKAYNQSATIMALSHHSRHLYKFARDGLEALGELSTALSGMSQAEIEESAPSIDCAYSRCPGLYQGAESVTRLRMVCGGCLNRGYCSQACQIADWNFGFPEPHSVVCASGR